LSRIHLAWGLGALSCPWLFRVALNVLRPNLFFVLLGLSLPLFAAIPFLRRASRPRRLMGNASEQRTQLSLGTRLHFALALFLYAGVENSISGWLPTYVGRLFNPSRHLGQIDTRDDGTVAAFAFTLLWGGVLAGRAVLPTILKYVSESRLLKSALASTVLCVVALIAVPSLISGPQRSMSAIAAIYGLSIAGVYPILMARLIRESGGTRGIGWVFASTSVGGAVLPWLTGIASKQSNALRVGFLIPAAATLGLLFLVSALPLSSPRILEFSDVAAERVPKSGAQ
jgi:FHS family glucose/mannose:H+ symporter-like MFS transporter